MKLKLFAVVISCIFLGPSFAEVDVQVPFVRVNVDDFGRTRVGVGRFFNLDTSDYHGTHLNVGREVEVHTDPGYTYVDAGPVEVETYNDNSSYYGEQDYDEVIVDSDRGSTDNDIGVDSYSVENVCVIIKTCVYNYRRQLESWRSSRRVSSVRYEDSNYERPYRARRGWFFGRYYNR